jgi:HAD superfamily hydrolase (TIGR01490 family)
MTQGKIAAFFDLDRTLIDVNSAVLYAKFEKRHNRINYRQLFMSIFYTGLYHLNLLDMESAYQKVTQHYKGMLEQELAERTLAFFSAEVEPRLQPGARQALADHRQRGHRLVLLTSSSCYQAMAACQSWGLDHWIANQFPSKDGILDGTFVKPLCYGPGKVTLAEKWARQEGINLDQSYFYSDSYSDLPMLRRVGFPKVVNPDPKLKNYSRQMKWQVLNWDGSMVRSG